MHVFGPRGRYPYARKRTYTPRPASLADYRKMAATIGLQRVIFVQPSAYGADNRCMIDAIREVGGNARGVIGMDDSVGAEELPEMSRLVFVAFASMRQARAGATLTKSRIRCKWPRSASPHCNGMFRSSPI